MADGGKGRPAEAPFFAGVAEGPADGRAVWLCTADGLRIRMGIWGADAPDGTVLLFPGRTEYVEKYGRTAGDLLLRGYATVAVDWRGQGLADRLLPNAAIGHVGRFLDYQADVAAVVAAVRELGLPEPYHLLAHSMGGAIGLEALLGGLPVRSAVFSAPMWGILISPALRPVAWTLTHLSRPLRLGHVLAPGQSPEPYLLSGRFEDNTLTTDREMFAYMQRQLRSHPELALGGPSLRWLDEALAATRRLGAATPPDLPTLCFLGEQEAIVDPARIAARVDSWPSARLVRLPGARHEVLMERPATRARVLDDSAALFAAHR